MKRKVQKIEVVCDESSGNYYDCYDQIETTRLWRRFPATTIVTPRVPRLKQNKKWVNGWTNGGDDRERGKKRRKRKDDDEDDNDRGGGGEQDENDGGGNLEEEEDNNERNGGGFEPEEEERDEEREMVEEVREENGVGEGQTEKEGGAEKRGGKGGGMLLCSTIIFLLLHWLLPGTVHSLASVLVSSPFDNFRIECPQSSGAQRLAIRMVESQGQKRQDTVFVLSCQHIQDLYPWLEMPQEIADQDREDCRYTQQFDVLLEQKLSLTCKEREYLAGIARLADTRIQLECCRMRTRAETGCVQLEYDKPLGNGARTEIEYQAKLINAIEIDGGIIRVRFCDFSPRPIDAIMEDLAKKTTTRATTTAPPTTLGWWQTTTALRQQWSNNDGEIPAHPLLNDPKQRRKYFHWQNDVAPQPQQLNAVGPAAVPVPIPTQTSPAAAAHHPTWTPPPVQSTIQIDHQTVVQQPQQQRSEEYEEDEQLLVPDEILHVDNVGTPQQQQRMPLLRPSPLRVAHPQQQQQQQHGGVPQQVVSVQPLPLTPFQWKFGQNVTTTTMEQQQQPPAATQPRERQQPKRDEQAVPAAQPQQKENKNGQIAEQQHNGQKNHKQDLLDGNQHAHQSIHAAKTVQHQIQPEHDDQKFHHAVAVQQQQQRELQQKHHDNLIPQNSSGNQKVYQVQAVQQQEQAKRQHEQLLPQNGHDQQFRQIHAVEQQQHASTASTKGHQIEQENVADPFHQPAAVQTVTETPAGVQQETVTPHHDQQQQQQQETVKNEEKMANSSIKHGVGQQKQNIDHIKEKDDIKEGSAAVDDDEEVIENDKEEDDEDNDVSDQSVSDHHKVQNSSRIDEQQQQTVEIDQKNDVDQRQSDQKMNDEKRPGQKEDDQKQLDQKAQRTDDQKRPASKEKDQKQSDQKMGDEKWHGQKEDDQKQPDQKDKFQADQKVDDQKRRASKEKDQKQSDQKVSAEKKPALKEDNQKEPDQNEDDQKQFEKNEDDNSIRSDQKEEGQKQSDHQEQQQTTTEQVQAVKQQQRHPVTVKPFVMTNGQQQTDTVHIGQQQQQHAEQQQKNEDKDEVLQQQRNQNDLSFHVIKGFSSRGSKVVASSIPSSSLLIRRKGLRELTVTLLPPKVGQPIGPRISADRERQMAEIAIQERVDAIRKVEKGIQVDANPEAPLPEWVKPLMSKTNKILPPSPNGGGANEMQQNHQFNGTGSEEKRGHQTFDGQLKMEAINAKAEDANRTDEVEAVTAEQPEQKRQIHEKNETILEGQNVLSEQQQQQTRGGGKAEIGGKQNLIQMLQAVQQQKQQPSVDVQQRHVQPVHLQPSADEQEQQIQPVHHEMSVEEQQQVQPVHHQSSVDEQQQLVHPVYQPQQQELQRAQHQLSVDGQPQQHVQPVPQQQSVDEQRQQQQQVQTVHQQASAVDELSLNQQQQQEAKRADESATDSMHQILFGEPAKLVVVQPKQQQQQPSKDKAAEPKQQPAFHLVHSLLWPVAAQMQQDGGGKQFRAVQLRHNYSKNPNEAAAAVQTVKLWRDEQQQQAVTNDTDQRKNDNVKIDQRMSANADYDHRTNNANVNEQDGQAVLVEQQLQQDLDTETVMVQHHNQNRKSVDQQTPIVVTERQPNKTNSNQQNRAVAVEQQQQVDLKVHAESAAQNQTVQADQQQQNITDHHQMQLVMTMRGVITKPWRRLKIQPLQNGTEHHQTTTPLGSQLAPFVVAHNGSSNSNSAEEDRRNVETMIFPMTAEKDESILPNPNNRKANANIDIKNSGDFAESMMSAIERHVAETAQGIDINPDRQDKISLKQENDDDNQALIENQQERARDFDQMHTNKSAAVFTELHSSNNTSNDDDDDANEVWRRKSNNSKNATAAADSNDKKSTATTTTTNNMPNSNNLNTPENHQQQQMAPPRRQIKISGSRRVILLRDDVGEAPKRGTNGKKRRGRKNNKNKKNGTPNHQPVTTEDIFGTGAVNLPHTAENVEPAQQLSEEAFLDEQLPPSPADLPSFDAFPSPPPTRRKNSQMSTQLAQLPDYGKASSTKNSKNFSTKTTQKPQLLTTTTTTTEIEEEQEALPSAADDEDINRREETKSGTTATKVPTKMPMMQSAVERLVPNSARHLGRQFEKSTTLVPHDDEVPSPPRRVFPSRRRGHLSIAMPAPATAPGPNGAAGGGQLLPDEETDASPFDAERAQFLEQLGQSKQQEHTTSSRRRHSNTAVEAEEQQQTTTTTSSSFSRNEDENEAETIATTTTTISANNNRRPNIHKVGRVESRFEANSPFEKEIRRKPIVDISYPKQQQSSRDEKYISDEKHGAESDKQPKDIIQKDGQPLFSPPYNRPMQLMMMQAEDENGANGNTMPTLGERNDDFRIEQKDVEQQLVPMDEAGGAAAVVTMLEDNSETTKNNDAIENSIPISTTTTPSSSLLEATTQYIDQGRRRHHQRVRSSRRRTSSSSSTTTPTTPTSPPPSTAVADDIQQQQQQHDVINVLDVDAGGHVWTLAARSTVSVADDDTVQQPSADAVTVTATASAGGADRRHVTTTTQPPYDIATFYRLPSGNARHRETVLTFCSKRAAIRDASNMVIACAGEDGQPWTPPRCPPGTDCLPAADSTFQICCPVAAGRR